MNNRKKKFITKGIVTPLIIAVIITALFFAAYSPFSDFLFSDEREFQLADYSYSEIKEMEDYTFNTDEILKTDLPVPESDTIIGSAELSEQTIDLIYDANEINSAGRLSIEPDSAFVGEAGCTYFSCPKINSSAVKSLSVGDIVKIDTYYGSYEYKIVSVKVANGESELKKSADEISYAIAVYTDNSENAGLSDEYCVAVGEMVSGCKIKG